MWVEVSKKNEVGHECLNIRRAHGGLFLMSHPANISLGKHGKRIGGILTEVMFLLSIGFHRAKIGYNKKRKQRRMDRFMLHTMAGSFSNIFLMKHWQSRVMPCITNYVPLGKKRFWGEENAYSLAGSAV